MKVSFLVVVACLDYGGSYYDQTSLSFVLSAFEARLTLPRSKAAGVSANEHCPQCRSPLSLCNQHGFLPHSGECAQLVFQGGCYSGSRRSDFVVGCAHRNDVLLSRGHSAPLERDLRAKAHQSVVS